MAGEKDTDEDYGELHDDGTADVIRQVMSNMDNDDEDDGGFDTPMDEEDPRDVVDPEKGHELIDDAKMGKGKKDEKPSQDDDDDGSGDEKPSDDGDDAEEAKSDNDDKAEDGDDDLSGASIADLVAAVPETHRGEIAKRLGEASQINELFETRKAEVGFQGIDTPRAALNTFLDLNKYARSNPGEYLAWVAQQSGADKPHEVIAKAAERFGYKLVPTADDDDPFADPSEQKPAHQPGQPFGPDAQEHQIERYAAQVVFDVRTEVDPANGQLKRPYFSQLEGPIAQRVSAHIAAGNPLPTRAEISRFYDEAYAEAVSAFGGGQANPAAQSGGRVAQQNQEQAAQRAQKARRASKTIDGTGQGSRRHPALRDDAPLEEVVRHFAERG